QDRVDVRPKPLAAHEIIEHEADQHEADEGGQPEAGRPEPFEILAHQKKGRHRFHGGLARTAAPARRLPAVTLPGHWFAPGERDAEARAETKVGLILPSRGAIVACCGATSRR